MPSLVSQVCHASLDRSPRGHRPAAHHPARMLVSRGPPRRCDRGYSHRMGSIDGNEARRPDDHRESLATFDDVIERTCLGGGTLVANRGLPVDVEALSRLLPAAGGYA